ncbi:tyrosine-protein kinase sid-3-like isoform X3 [Varroa destructor]|uniref:mitogen-activated protein kinase kinase kinase n=1 Tax=Varroa destructor TaxID=109461 RepID=A0A7M7K4L6_VARDE|nr:tyrosine-protein kinase sid-3-like isoform X3 [Varroa destructor]
MTPEDGLAAAEGAAVQPRNGSGKRNSERLCRILYDYEGAVDDELTLVRGGIIEVLSDDPRVSGDEGWWTGKVDGKVGIFPLNYVKFESPSASTEHKADPSGGGVDDGGSKRENAWTKDGRERDGDSAGRSSSDGESLGPPEIQVDEVVKGKPIGQGGFCKVYEGKYRDQKVAIKALESQEPAAMLDAAKKEGGLVWNLRHEHIVKLYGKDIPYEHIVKLYGKDIPYEDHKQGLCLPNSWLIMEYCEGGSLNRVLEKNQVPLRILTEWSLHIAKGMQYIHSKRVIHRDLKSTNVLLTVPYQPDSQEAVPLKISDFGLARTNVEKSTVLSGGGTYAWMAPENIKFYKYSQRSDVWSFGVLIWELLTGQIPYKGVDPVAIAYGIGSEKLTLPIPETCPEKFKNLMTDCWNADPHRRPLFDKIIYQLEDIFNSSSLDVLHESFHTMQDRWREEIAMRIEQIKQRENSLKTREEELNLMQEKLTRDMLAVKKRELIVLERESEIARKAGQLASETPPAPRRRGKFKKPLEISGPTDCVHIMSWDNDNVVERLAEYGSPISGIVPVSPNLNANRTRSRTTSGSGSVAKDSHLSLHLSPTGPRCPLGSQGGLGSPNLLPAPFTYGHGNHRERSPRVSRAPMPGVLHTSNSCGGSVSSLVVNGGHKGKTWSPSTISPASLLQLQQHDPPVFQRALHPGDQMMIVNPSVVPLQDQLGCLAGRYAIDAAPSYSRIHHNNREKESKPRKNFICSVKGAVSTVLSAIGLKDRQSVTLQNSSHSRSYDELGSGEHMSSELPRAYDDTHLRGYTRHNTYHGQMTQRNSTTRPSIFAGGQSSPWSPHATQFQTTVGLPHSPLTARRRSSTTSHDSDQAYNSASSGFGPSPLGNPAALTTTPQTSDYPFTPSSAEVGPSSIDTICSQQQHTQFTPVSQHLPPPSTYYGVTQVVHSPFDARLTGTSVRGSSTASGGLPNIASPASSQCSSVFDNPGAAPRSPPPPPPPPPPPRTPQLYARNMSTPNANAYKIQCSPYSQRRKTSFPEVQHLRQSNLDRPSTLSLNLPSGARSGSSYLTHHNTSSYSAHHAPQATGHPHRLGNSGTPTPDRTPPSELMEIHLPSAAGSRQPLHYGSHHYADSSPSSQLTNMAVVLRETEIPSSPRGWFHDQESVPAPISPAPSTPPGGTTPQRRPTVRELEEDFSFSL